VFCGFGGDDCIHTLDAGDIFLGGAGKDGVFNQNGGTFNGGPSSDMVVGQNGGVFNQD
jgi:hypothetical protein